MKPSLVTLLTASLTLASSPLTPLSQAAGPELTPASWSASPLKFTFGTFDKPGVVAAVGEIFDINTTLAGADDGSFGGIGFNDLNSDLDASGYSLEITAKLDPTNTAETFNILLGDRDGTDSGPAEGAEDYLFTISTSEFNAEEFTTFRLPLGDGSESGTDKSYGFENGGDGAQNFGLFQIQIQVNAGGGDSSRGLVIQVMKVALVPREGGEGE